MAYLNDRVLDNGLTVLDTEANQLVICSASPTTYAEAFTTYKLGTKTSPNVQAPADGTPNGRSTTVAAFSDGSVSGTGTASHWALIDTVNSRLLASNTLASSQAVTSGNSFSLASFDIRIPDAA